MSKISSKYIESNLMKQKQKISEQIRQNVAKINNNSEVLRIYDQKRREKSLLNTNQMKEMKELMKCRQTLRQIKPTFRPSLKKRLDIEAKQKFLKRVSFSVPKPQTTDQSKARKLLSELQTTAKMSSNSAKIGTNGDKRELDSESESDTLCIDLSQDSEKESNPSISDSDDSFGIDLFKRKLKTMRRMSAMSDRSETKRSKDWTNHFNEQMGDPSKVVEITVEDEDEDNRKFELISSDNSNANAYDLDKCYEVLKSAIYSEFEKQELIEENIDKSVDKLNQTNSCFKNFIDSQTVVTKINKPNDKYICIFCPEICETSDVAKEHYLSHCGVYLECGECRQKFTSLQSYRKHNSQHLDRKKMWNLDEFMDAKKWCDLYIDYIDKHEELFQNYSQTNQMFCSVCHRIRDFYEKTETKDKVFRKSLKYSKVSFDEELVRNHLHQHFQYFPYECIDCRFDDKKTEFCLNSKARQHLLKVHNIENAFELKQNELKTYFDRKKSIKKMDYFIDYCFRISKNMNSLAELLSSKCDKRQIFVSK